MRKFLHCRKHSNIKKRQATKMKLQQLVEEKVGFLIVFTFITISIGFRCFSLKK